MNGGEHIKALQVAVFPPIERCTTDGKEPLRSLMAHRANGVGHRNLLTLW